MEVTNHFFKNEWDNALKRLEELAVILVSNGWMVAVEDVNEDLDYFTIQPPSLKTAKSFEEQQSREKENCLFTERPKTQAQNTPQSLRKALRKLEASVAKNSFLGTPSKHAHKNTADDEVSNFQLELNINFLTDSYQSDNEDDQEEQSQERQEVRV